MKDFTVTELIDRLAQLSDAEQLELCDALVDDPRLRELLETIDDFLYLEAEEHPPANLQKSRSLN